MRRSTTTALGLGAVFAALAMTGCAGHTGPTDVSASARGVRTAAPSVPLTSAQLDHRLLTESDLGEGYTLKPEVPRHNDDVTVIGCPALQKLGGDTATGSSLDFARKAKSSFAYTASGSSEVSEELYSDNPTKLSKGISKVFDAMLSCPSYQVVSGTTAVDIDTEKSTAPDLGDEQWTQLLTFSAGGQRSVVKQTAIRDSNILVLVSGSPGLVDAHLGRAVNKALASR
ncbi:hypothetical protein ACN2WE_31070 [Streptomyces sp. cg28]|uniref:hypothetical protein n=1 Tax=Streptomyces sp. cg28 TaxID=3403457 RepID=UPI003B22860B